METGELHIMILNVLRGTIAGYVGTAAMDAAQTSIIPAVSSWLESRSGTSDGQHSSDAASEDQHGQEHGDDGEVDEQSLSSPEKVARRGADLLGIELNREQIAAWGNRVHWIYGTQWGIVYQVMRQKPGPISGLFYGAALWAVSDELLLWALRIAKAPSAYPLKTHLQALAAHCVYGTVVGAVAKGLRR